MNNPSDWLEVRWYNQYVGGDYSYSTSRAYSGGLIGFDKVIVVQVQILYVRVVFVTV